MSKLLLVEDDPSIFGSLVDYLSSKEYAVEHTADGNEGLSRLQIYQYDVAILDWELPGLSGLEVCARYRASGGKTPVIMLTARSELDDKVRGLDSGADDYLTKPFHPRELEARIRSVLRRPENVMSQLCVKHITVDAASRTVLSHGEPVKLNRREYQLLEFLVRHPGQVFAHETLLNRVWSSESDATEQALRQSIRRLRTAIDKNGEPSIIVNVPGVGYKLE